MKKLPLIYACAGCSQAGCRAYLVAREIQRRGLARMSCLAGVAARRPNFMKELENRALWVVDGCPIECARGAIESLASIERHLKLHELGIPKNGTSKLGTRELVDRLLSEPVRTDPPVPPTLEPCNTPSLTAPTGPSSTSWPS